MKLMKWRSSEKFIMTEAHGGNKRVERDEAGKVVRGCMTPK